MVTSLLLQAQILHPSCLSFTSPPKWYVYNVKPTTPLSCLVSGPPIVFCIMSTFLQPHLKCTGQTFRCAFYPPSTLGNFISSCFWSWCSFYLEYSFIPLPCYLRMPIHFSTPSSISNPLWNLSWLISSCSLCSFFIIQHTAIFISIILNCTFWTHDYLSYYFYFPGRQKLCLIYSWGTWKKTH